MSKMAGTLTTAPKGSGEYIGFGSGPNLQPFGADGYLGDNAQKLTADELIPPNLLDAISRIDTTGMTEEEIKAAVAREVKNNASGRQNNLLADANAASKLVNNTAPEQNINRSDVSDLSGVDRFQSLYGPSIDRGDGLDTRVNRPINTQGGTMVQASDGQRLDSLMRSGFETVDKFSDPEDGTQPNLSDDNIQSVSGDEGGNQGGDQGGKNPSRTIIDPQKDLAHYFESEELIRRAIENGSLPIDQLTDEMQRKYKVGPYAETPEGETPEGETPEGETPEGETPEGIVLTPEEEIRKQEILDGTSSGDIDVTTLSKEELEALGIDPADLNPSLTTQMKERLGDMGQKVKDAFGEVVEFGKGVFEGATTSPEKILQDAINNSLGTRVGIKLNEEGIYQFEIFIGLPIPGLTGEGLTIDITDGNGNIILDDKAKAAIKKVYAKAKVAMEELPDKIEEKLEKVFGEIEAEGGEVESAEQDEEGNILVKIKDAAGKIITKILSPLDIIGVPTGSKAIGSVVGKSLAIWGIGTLLSRNNDGGGSLEDIGQEGPFGSAPAGDAPPGGSPFVSDDEDASPGKKPPEGTPPGKKPPEGTPPEGTPPEGTPPEGTTPDKLPDDNPLVSGTVTDVETGGTLSDVLTGGGVSDSDSVPGIISDLPSPESPLNSSPSIPPDGGDSGDGGNPFFSIPGSPQPRRSNTEEEEDDEFVPFYFGQFENIYNPVDVVVNPEARKQFRKVGIASLGVRDSVVASLLKENDKTQSTLNKLQQQARNIGKPKNQMKAARGGLVPSSFPDKLNRIMGYK